MKEDIGPLARLESPGGSSQNEAARAYLALLEVAALNATLKSHGARTEQKRPKDRFQA